MKIISGLELSSAIYKKLESLPQDKSLGIVLASNDEPSRRYIKLKSDKCKELGINVELFQPDLTQESLAQDIKNKIDEWNNSANVSGILVQLPLHESIQSQRKEILDQINPRKDVDGLTTFNLNNIESNQNYFLPATVSAVIKSLEFVALDRALRFEEYLKQNKVVIINNSDLIGKPLKYFLSKYTQVTNLDENTNDIKTHTQNADILISATGVGQIFDESFVKSNAVLIDITSVLKEGRVVGDFVIEPKLTEKISYITPVPGGIGPLTIACLLENLFKTK